MKRRLSSSILAASTGLLLALAGCGDRVPSPDGASESIAAATPSATTGRTGRLGEVSAKPGGGLFLPDPHSSGTSTELHLAEVLWGRLVDVHDATADGTPSPVPASATWW